MVISYWSSYWPVDLSITCVDKITLAVKLSWSFYWFLNPLVSCGGRVAWRDNKINYFLQNRNNNYRNNNNNFLQQGYINNNNNFPRNLYNNNNNVNNNNRQLNPGQYKKFNSGQFQNRSKQHKNRFLQNNDTQQNSNYTEITCNYCKKPGHLVRDCKIRSNNQSQTAHQENSKALPSTGPLRKA